MKTIVYKLNSIKNLSNEETVAQAGTSSIAENFDELLQDKILKEQRDQKCDSSDADLKNPIKSPFLFLFKALRSSTSKQERSGQKRHSVFTAIELSL